MEKLIELLNKFEKARIEKINSEGKLFVKLAFKPYTKEILTNKAYRDCWSEICSKYYGFIKRLVDNEKVDFRKLDYKKFSGDIPARYYLGTYIRYSFENEILMTLSIQDNPIEFLVSILK